MTNSDSMELRSIMALMDISITSDDYVVASWSEFENDDEDFEADDFVVTPFDEDEDDLPCDCPSDSHSC